MSDLYDADIALWSERQADLLRRLGQGERVNDQVDWANVVEEIEALGRSDKREVFNRLAVICTHLLKWQYQPAGRSSSWRGSVVEARLQIAELIEESPSLAPYPATQLTKAYTRGRRIAEAETGIFDLPETCPWTIEQLLSHAFWPNSDPS